MMADRIPDSIQAWAKERPFNERLRLAVLSSQVRLEIVRAANKEGGSQ